MSHLCEILVFDSEMGLDAVESECFEWQWEHCDRRECGARNSMWPIHFQDRLFDDYAQAEKYLNGTFGDYQQIAVLYREGEKTCYAVACEVHC